MNVILVGAGIIGYNHAAALLRRPDLKITAVVDNAPAALERFADWLEGQGAPRPAGYATLDEAMTAGTASLVVICSPTGTHTPLAAAALDAGLHVVVEKPLDASLPAARELARRADAATTRGQVFSVISQHRFDPASAVVARAIADGTFGSLTSAVASVAWWRSQDYYDSAGWRGTWALDGGGATMNQGVHTVDLLLWFLGRPVAVFAYTRTLAHERIEVEDTAVATVRFANGAVAVLHATTAAYPGLAVRLQVHATRGSAVIHDDQLEYFHAAGGADGNQASSVVPAAEQRDGPRAADGFVLGHLRQYDDILDAISTGRPPAVTAGDALLAVAVVKALYLSSHLSQPIAIEAVLGGEYDDVLAAVEKS